MAETFKLPCSSYEELIKLFQAYANTKEGTALSLDEITQATGVPRTIVSKNNGFMVQVGLITEGNKKAATETGRALGRAYTSKITDEVDRIWKEIIAEVDFLNRMLSAVRIRNGMDRSSFINHIIYSSGLKDAKESRAGAGALIEIFKSVGVLSEVDGKLSVLDEPSSARVSVASNTISAEQTHSEPVAQQALPVATISAKNSIVININDILKEQQKNRGEIDVKITSILGIIKSPYLLSESLCARMFELGNSMKKLKLPKTIAKDFFTELASADRCVCDRCIGERERTAILKRADQYLGSDQQSVLNTVKSSLMDSVYDERLKKAFEEHEELRAQANRLDTRFKANEEKLIKAGGEKARELQERIEELIRLISIARDELERIESKDENDASLTEENNLHKADQKFKYYEQEIAKATRTNTALRKKELVDSLVNEIKLQATTALKQEIVRKTNEKLRRVIVDDYVEIESIDRYIKLKGRDGASEGQTLSIAYCFLGTLFEDSELEFPFIIDSPTGKMDFEKRQAVADIIPLVFNQMIAFVQSAEVERFADRFYANPDSQYLTVVASPQDQAVVVYEGIDFFDSYQREHKGDEK